MSEVEELKAEIKELKAEIKELKEQFLTTILKLQGKIT
jgi:cell division protein FtsB